MLNRGRVAGILTLASARASEQPIARGLPPLPRTTPHTLRRTYISIALLANNFDVKWVMGQVGHADSRMTMDGETQTRTGDTTIFRDAGTSREEPGKSCKSGGRRSGGLRRDTRGFRWFRPA